MKTTPAIFLLFLLLLGAWLPSAVFAQASLPAFYSGPWHGTTLPAGWTASGLGTDYAVNYDAEDGNAAKFDGNGDNLVIRYNTSAEQVTYFIRGNSLGGDYTFSVQESANGSAWTDAAVYNSSNPISGSIEERAAPLQAASRYVRFIYVKKASGNVGLDGVRIHPPSIPVIHFNPSESVTTPVSNELAVAISLLPAAGGGIQSWSLPVTFQGAASLSNFVFRMTPAAGDYNKTFSLTVVATNSVGATTSSLPVFVTAYVEPEPHATFTPDPPYQVLAGHTQQFSVAFSPAGSGITSWSLDPAPVGALTRSGATFTFATAAADAHTAFTFTLLATNSFGTGTSTVDIAVGAYVAPPVPGSYICTFEDGSKSGYAAGNVTLNGKTWELDGVLIGADATDRKLDGRAARFRYIAGEEQAMTLQSTLSGVGSIGFWYAPFSSHGADAPSVAVEIADSLTGHWLTLGEVHIGAVEDLTWHSTDVNVNDAVYVRLRLTSGVGSRSGNIDNITITPYTPAGQTPYEQFLLKFNVTPGDPGTLPDDDYDGDGWTNQQEFDANTNPYDPDKHP